MKKGMKTLALAASVLALAGTAQAATVDINVYGASAQYLFWNDAADNFLISRGCTGVTQAQDTSGKHGITTGTCSSDTVNIRYSAKASFESCLSLNGTTNPDSCPSPTQRKMAHSVTDTQHPHLPDRHPRRLRRGR
jgi:opacity protein-like surface antigen